MHTGVCLPRANYSESFELATTCGGGRSSRLQSVSRGSRVMQARAMRRYLKMSYMNRRGFLLAASAGLGLGAISLPPQMLVRMSGDVLSAPHTPDPGAWSDNSITLAWLGHATVLINFYGVRVLTDPAVFPRIGVDIRLATVGPASTHRLRSTGVAATRHRCGATVARTFRPPRHGIFAGAARASCDRHSCEDRRSGARQRGI